MANRRKKIKHKAFSIANKIFPFVKAAAPPVAFLEQITSKDRLTLGATFTNASTSTQAKILTNIVTGRLAGITLFHKITDAAGVVTLLPTAPQTINPAGVVNKWTTGGLIGIGYGIIGKAVNNMSTGMGLGNVIPATSKIKSIGKGVFVGGALGGFFDAPTGSNSTGITSFPSLSEPTLQVTSSHTSYHNTGGDSTLSGIKK